MPQISSEIISDMKAALDDIGEARQLVADRIARDCDPVLGAAVMRLMIAAEESTKKGPQAESTPIWGRLFGFDRQGRSAAAR